jgi:hypothetical protein
MQITTKRAFIFFVPLAPMNMGVDGTVPFPDKISFFGVDDNLRVQVGVGGPFTVPDWVSNTWTYFNGVAAGNITEVGA